MPPKISIVTPSFNQGQFIEETIHSVLDQNYPNLEYLVIDGGSTDQTIDIIRKYETRLSYWESEKDRGQVHAINKRLARVTGDIFAFINSDDIYLPGTFATVGGCPLHEARKAVAETEAFDEEFDRSAEVYESRLHGADRRWCRATRFLRKSYAASKSGNKSEGARWLMRALATYPEGVMKRPFWGCFRRLTTR